MSSINVKPECFVRKEAAISKIKSYDLILKRYGIKKDPQWLENPDEPVPLWVVWETVIELIDQLDPPGHPYD